MMRIYLIGFMGSGKTTLGRKLAKNANLQFIDMDSFIEERHCKTVPQIFEEEGEAEFRNKERKALSELSQFTDVVIATGGGAPCFFDNIDLMNRTGKTIYLNIPPKILAERLKKSRTERPLIKGKSTKELEEYINSTLEKRDPFYKKAKYQITRPDTKPAEILKMISD
jgi:shikimate kinase